MTPGTGQASARGHRRRQHSARHGDGQKIQKRSRQVNLFCCGAVAEVDGEVCVGVWVCVWVGWGWGWGGGGSSRKRLSAKEQEQEGSLARFGRREREEDCSEGGDLRGSCTGAAEQRGDAAGWRRLKVQRPGERYRRRGGAWEPGWRGNRACNEMSGKGSAAQCCAGGSVWDVQPVGCDPCASGMGIVVCRGGSSQRSAPAAGAGRRSSRPKTAFEARPAGADA